MNRMRKMLALLALCTLAAWFWGVTTSQAQEQPIVVEGQVISGTSNGGSVSGVTVILHQEGAEQHQDMETITDAEGRFRFDGVAFVSGVSYAVSVMYQEALYGQDVDLSSGSLAPISLTVYEATDNEEVLSASTVSVLFSGVDRATETLQVLEIMTLKNTSDRTYVTGGEAMKPLGLGLPVGAQSLHVESDLSGAEVVQVGQEFALIAGVPPGEHQVMAVYQFPYSGTGSLFTRSLPYGAGRLRVLAPEGLLQLSSPQLGTAKGVTIGEQIYQLLDVTGLPRGLQVTVALTILPQAAQVEQPGKGPGGISFQYAALAGLGLVVVFLVGFSLWRRSGRRQLTARVEGASTSEAERQTLVQMLVDLQQGFESGAITEGEYQRRHSELRRRLVAILRQRGQAARSRTKSKPE